MLWFLMLTWVWVAFESIIKLKCTCRCRCAAVMMMCVWTWKGTKKYLHRRICACLQNKPAAVILGVSLQRGGGPGQAQAWEGVVVCELRVRQAGHAVRLIIHVLPVWAERRRPLGERSKQVGVQLVHYLLVHAGFKLSGKEGGSHRLLQREREGRREGGEQRSEAGRDEIKRRKKMRRLRHGGVPGWQGNKCDVWDVYGSDVWAEENVKIEGRVEVVESSR